MQRKVWANYFPRVSKPRAHFATNHGGSAQSVARQMQGPESPNATKARTSTVANTKVRPSTSATRRHTKTDVSRTSKKIRSPLFFRASDGTLKNLASSVDSQLSDKRQHLLEVPESSPEDIVNVPVQLPLLFRGNLGYSQRPATHSPSAGDEKSRSRSAITAPTNRDIRQHDIKRNSFVHSQKTKKNSRSSRKANAEEILKTLQSLPRPRQYHKPLQHLVAPNSRRW